MKNYSYDFQIQQVSCAEPLFYLSVQTGQTVSQKRISPLLDLIFCSGAPLLPSQAVCSVAALCLEHSVVNIQQDADGVSNASKMDKPVFEVIVNLK